MEPTVDSGAQLLLLRPRTTEVGSLSHMALGNGRWRHLLPMVLLGLLPRLFSYRWKIYWESLEFRF